MYVHTLIRITGIWIFQFVQGTHQFLAKSLWTHHNLGEGLNRINQTSFWYYKLQLINYITIQHSFKKMINPPWGKHEHDDISRAEDMKWPYWGLPRVPPLFIWHWLENHGFSPPSFPKLKFWHSGSSLQIRQHSVKSATFLIILYSPYKYIVLSISSHFPVIWIQLLELN